MYVDDNNFGRGAQTGWWLGEERVSSMVLAASTFPAVLVFAVEQSHQVGERLTYNGNEVTRLRARLFPGDSLRLMFA